MAKKDGKPGRFKQILETYRLTKRSDPRIGWILLGIFIGILAVFVILGFIFGLLIYLDSLVRPVRCCDPCARAGSSPSNPSRSISIRTVSGAWSADLASSSFQKDRAVASNTCW